MLFVKEAIALEQLRMMAEERFGDLVKAVVDVRRRVMVIGGELHSDEEAFLLEQGSKQQDLWGINIYPDLPEEERVEFDSLINLRPWQGNRTRGVDDPKIRRIIIEIVESLIKE